MRICLRLPATDQNPLRHNRNSEQEQKQRAAGNNRPEIDVEHTCARRNPLIALRHHQRRQIGISQEDQQLQRPAEDDLRCSRPFRHLDVDRVAAGDSTATGEASARAVAKPLIVGCW